MITSNVEINSLVNVPFSCFIHIMQNTSNLSMNHQLTELQHFPQYILNDSFGRQGTTRIASFQKKDKITVRPTAWTFLRKLRFTFSLFRLSGVAQVYTYLGETSDCKEYSTKCLFHHIFCWCLLKNHSRWTFKHFV